MIATSSTTGIFVKRIQKYHFFMGLKNERIKKGGIKE